MKNLIIILIVLMISPLVQSQSKPTVVASVDLIRYQGFWYEITRLLVGEPGLKYLWILAREKEMDDQTYNMLLQKAVDNGYDVKPIIRTEQDCEE